MTEFTEISQLQEPELVTRAKEGDARAFETLVSFYRPRLRNVLRKMIGHPHDCDDLYQETLIKASKGLHGFKGDSNFGTWLCAIGVNLGLDFLRKQKAWRARAQVIYGNICHDDPEWGGEVAAALSDDGFAFDVYEHIAYCWSCVARSLPAEQNAALVYREFLDMTNREAAKQMHLSESVFRHTLADARASMQARFDDLCSLVNKQGVCYQCAGLRNACAADKQGKAPPQPLQLEQRLEITSAAELDTGRSQSMHELFYKRTQQVESAEMGNANEASKCDGSKH
ncbi:RNA polymerase sigma-70 factor (ECF subfamily) [Alteromonadaceae bacterium 2753L.S.0a.02]|nr:RNA polymerase sigma-70 factor (ECF subfamily) [Alteromonadaceae bacterium 2753L.S.0a.02]